MNELWNRGLYHALLQSCRVNHSPQLAIHLLNHMTERVSPTKYVCLLAAETLLSISHHHQLVSSLPVSISTSFFIFIVFRSSNVSACWHEMTVSRELVSISMSKFCIHVQYACPATYTV